jgi:hypothetical protein
MLVVRLALALLVACVAPLGASAGTLTSATWISEVEGLAFPVGITAAGTSTATSVSVGVSVPPTALTRFVPGTAVSGLILMVQRNIGGSAPITATPSMAAGGIPGGLRVVTAFHAKGSTFMAGINEFLNVPLAAGAAATYTGSFSIHAASHTYSVRGFGWNPHTQTFTGLTSNGIALPDVVAMGSFDLSAMGGGTVTLVAPTRLQLGGPIVNRTTVSLTTLTLSFVPEPNALWLLGAGALALVAAGRRL